MNRQQFEDTCLQIANRLRDLTMTDPGVVASPHERRSEKVIHDIVFELCKDLDAEMQKRISDEFLGLGPVATYFDDNQVTEIIVNGPQSIWAERRGHLEQLDDAFFNDLTYRNFIHRICKDADIQVNLEYPFADGKWREFRVNVCAPPATPKYSSLCFRRHPTNPWTLESLREQDWSSPQGMNHLKTLLSSHKNFIVVGCTGSGKTSVLNACLQSLPKNERVVLIEDTPELFLPNQVSTKLLTRHDPQSILPTVDQTQLVKQSLRMRPDRIVMGEIRGQEAKDLLMAFATGHSGCMGTLHADSAKQALIRLEMLIQMGAPQWNLHAVRSLILMSLHAIIVVKRSHEGRRVLEGIYQLSSLEEFGFLLEKIAV